MWIKRIARSSATDSSGIGPSITFSSTWGYGLRLCTIASLAASSMRTASLFGTPGPPAGNRVAGSSSRPRRSSRLLNLQRRIPPSHNRVACKARACTRRHVHQHSKIPWAQLVDHEFSERTKCHREPRTVVCAHQGRKRLGVARDFKPNFNAFRFHAIATPPSLAVPLRRIPTESHQPLCRTKRSDGNGRCFRCSSRSWRWRPQQGSNLRPWL